MSDFLLGLVCWPLAALGCLFVISGAVGLVRLPDLYTRLHATSVTDTGGTVLIAAALLLHAVFTFADPMAAIKLVLITGFTLFTAPTASHALAKTAMLVGQVPVGEDGRPLLDSPEQASRLARSREPAPEDADGVAAGAGHGIRQQMGTGTGPSTGSAS